MTLALNAEQLRAYIRELDEEYRRNRLAAETLLRSLERNEAGAAAVPARSMGTREGASEQPLISMVEQLVAAYPEQVWDVKNVISTLERQGITPESSDLNKTVGNALGKLAKQHKLELVRHGRGKSPSVYRWKLGATVSGSLPTATFWDKPQ